MITGKVQNRRIEQSQTETHQPATVLTEWISDIVLRLGTPTWWWVGFVIAFGLFMLLIVTLFRLVTVGVGIWGNNVPVVWATDIINFVFWVGIGHAGTLISAILLLMRQTWRTSLSRFAEAMTLFALACAALGPIFHLGRPWLAIWLAPYPDSLGLNPQWRSPLPWDFFAINTYLTVSALFWFMGLIPDLAALRDKAKRRSVKLFYAALAMGWRGDAVHWERYHQASFLLAALATPLVISVHSIVSMDFAVAIVPAWHHTIFPPYFVAGAVFSGLAMVLIIAIPLRSALRLHNLITMTHFDNAAKLMLVTGLLVAYGYAVEFFGPYYTGNQNEWASVMERSFGFYAPLFWTMVVANVAVPQLLWLHAVRTNLSMLMGISFIVLIGMWLERFVIIVIGLHDTYLATMSKIYVPRIWDVLFTVGPFGLFLVLLYLFVRLLPLIPMFELHEIMKEGTVRGIEVEGDVTGESR
jgi:molybdopterin-containing oxidoreductase family membrane subunit